MIEALIVFVVLSVVFCPYLQSLIRNTLRDTLGAQPIQIKELPTITKDAVGPNSPVKGNRVTFHNRGGVFQSSGKVPPVIQPAPADKPKIEINDSKRGSERGIDTQWR